MLYAPKNEDVCENIEHKKHEYREEIYAGEEGRPKRMCGPWKCCSPPKGVARIAIMAIPYGIIYCR